MACDEVDVLEHTWLPFMGMWKDDPTFDEFVEEIESFRREMDELCEPDYACCE